MDEAFLNLVAEVERKRAEIRCSRSGAFFRGHARSDFALVPSLLRQPVRADTEHNLYHECYARANDLVRAGATSWERLAFLQHYGIPTRLLDWTESLGVALFFAIHESPVRAHIWVVNAFLLNKSTAASREPRILMAGLDDIPDYHDCFIRVDDRQEWPYPRPLFLQIPWTTNRLRAQSGFFTFHNSAEPVETSCKRYTRRIEIPPDAIPGALRFLELAGITEHSVFPDFVGLAGFMRRRYCL